jgi:hypothetical protein
MKELTKKELIQDLKTLYWTNDKLLEDNTNLINMNLKLIKEAEESLKEYEALIQVLENIQKVVEKEKLDHLFEDIKLNL